MYLVYGNATIRFDSDGIEISSALRSIGYQAYGFDAATLLKRLMRAPTRLRWVSMSSPRRARRAFSKIG